MKNNGEHEVGDIVHRIGRTWQITKATRTQFGDVIYDTVPYPEVAK